MTVVGNFVDVLVGCRSRQVRRTIGSTRSISSHPRHGWGGWRQGEAESFAAKTAAGAIARICNTASSRRSNNGSRFAYHQGTRSMSTGDSTTTRWTGQVQARGPAGAATATATTARCCCWSAKAGHVVDWMCVTRISVLSSQQARIVRELNGSTLSWVTTIAQSFHHNTKHQQRNQARANPLLM